jgi:transcription termination factor Rho
VLLIDERPEEVTDMKRNVERRSHRQQPRPGCRKPRPARAAHDRTLQAAGRDGQGRLPAAGLDHALARAFNKWVGNTGRTMSGGVDIKAMDIPKKLFATARAFEEGGSLTIVGTALIDTGSRMDEVIFQEFKGTGNMELVLDRKLADRRVWPAIDISNPARAAKKSCSPRDAACRHHAAPHAQHDAPRRCDGATHEARLAKFKSNEEFIKLIKGARD